jgi:hypothetical protein
LDEVFLTIKGERHYHWRAVDQDGHVLDILVQSRRNKHAAKKFFRKLLKGLTYVPRVLITDPEHWRISPCAAHGNLFFLAWSALIRAGTGTPERAASGELSVVQCSFLQSELRAMVAGYLQGKVNLCAANLIPRTWILSCTLSLRDVLFVKPGRDVWKPQQAASALIV